MELNRFILNAKQEIRELKRVSPWLFVEFTELQRARNEAREANERLAAAQATWDNLGK